MSKILDSLEAATHGTASGYKSGCKSKGACPNRGSRVDLTCERAYRAYVHYRALFRLGPDVRITRAMLREAKGLKPWS